MKDEVIILLLALAFDLSLGEPPNALHPVVWMGRWIGWGESRLSRHAPAARPASMFVYGMMVVVLGLFTFTLAAWALSSTLKNVYPLLYILGSAWLLKTTFAYKALVHAAHAVALALRTGNLAEARRLLAWHLVSRDTSALDASLIAAATVESVAENFGDGIVAPLFYFALFGLPGAFAYRFANTADAMLGYHDARREYLGKFAARLDDALNWIPARLAALLLIVSAPLSHENPKQAWRIGWRDHGRTASPNAGWPMSAMAGALGVMLVKVGHYQLGDGNGTLAADTITRSLRLASVASVVAVIVLLLVLQVRAY